MSQFKKDANLDENKIINENRSNNEYQIRPSIGKTFPIAEIRDIINEVLLQILDGNLALQWKECTIYLTSNELLNLTYYFRERICKKRSI